MSASVSFIPGGQPSTMHPTEAQWLSPYLARKDVSHCSSNFGDETTHVVTLNARPNVDMMANCLRWEDSVIGKKLTRLEYIIWESAVSRQK